jgi:hypothetical protein
MQMGKKVQQTPSKFLTSLFGQEDQGHFAEIRVLDRDGTFVKRKFCPTAASVQSVLDEFGNSRCGKSVYFGVGKRSTRKKTEEGKLDGTKANIHSVPGFWADIDVEKAAMDWVKVVGALHDLPGCLQPSILVKSGRGLHAYWLFDKPLVFPESGPERAQKISDFEYANKQFAKMCSADMVFDITRVLRLPGSYNPKAAKDKLVHVIWNYYWHRTCPMGLFNAQERFGLYLGRDGFVEANELPDMEAKTPTASKALELAWERGNKNWSRRIEDLEEMTRIGGGYPYIGLDEFQLRATATMWAALQTKPKKRYETVVRSVMRMTMRIKARWAPDERWDDETEIAKIQNKLDRWVSKWDLLEEMKKAEKKRLAKERREQKKTEAA